MDKETIVAKDSEFKNYLFILFNCLVVLFPFLYGWDYFLITYLAASILLTYAIVVRNRKKYYRILFNADSLTISYLFSNEKREIHYNEIVQIERKGMEYFARVFYRIDNFFIRTSNENLRIEKSDESKDGVEMIKLFWKNSGINYTRKEADLKREFHPEDIKYGYYRGEVIKDVPSKTSKLVMKIVLISIGLSLVTFFFYVLSQR